MRNSNILGAELQRAFSDMEKQAGRGFNRWWNGVWSRPNAFYQGLVTPGSLEDKQRARDESTQKDIAYRHRQDQLGAEEEQKRMEDEFEHPGMITNIMSNFLGTRPVSPKPPAPEALPTKKELEAAIASYSSTPSTPADRKSTRLNSSH